MKIYKEKLPPQWWDGRFNVIDVKCSLNFGIELSEIGLDYLWQKRKSAFFMNETTSMFLQSFVSIKDGVYRNHAYFRLVKDAQKKVSIQDCSKDDWIFERFYVDAIGYGAKVEKNCYSAYHALMLPPFQNQTGYCIGALCYVTEFDNYMGTKKKMDVYVLTPEEFCAKVPWQHLMKYAKPFDDFFDAARICTFPEKSYLDRRQRGRRVVPLYIGTSCAGAEIPDAKESGCREYISFEDYDNL